MEHFIGDACPRCGERVELEYGHVYAENGNAWHEVECLNCGTRYTACYKFAEIIDIEYPKEV